MSDREAVDEHRACSWTSQERFAPVSPNESRRTSSSSSCGSTSRTTRCPLRLQASSTESCLARHLALPRRPVLLDELVAGISPAGVRAWLPIGRSLPSVDAIDWSRAARSRVTAVSDSTSAPRRARRGSPVPRTARRVPSAAATRSPWSSSTIRSKDRTARRRPRTGSRRCQHLEVGCRRAERSRVRRMAVACAGVRPGLVDAGMEDGLEVQDGVRVVERDDVLRLDLVQSDALALDPDLPLLDRGRSRVRASGRRSLPRRGRGRPRRPARECFGRRRPGQPVTPDARSAELRGTGSRRP